MRSTKLFSVIDGACPVLRLLRVTFFVICLNLISLPLRAQERALSTNLADYAAGGTFNAEASRSLSRHWSAVAQVKYNPFAHKQRLFAAGARYWPWYVYSGWWMAGRMQWQEYRRTGAGPQANREGDRVGAAFTAGYARMLSARVNLDFGAGFWAGHDRYVTYACPRCGRKTGSGAEVFFLPSDIILSISYIF